MVTLDAWKDSVKKYSVVLVCFGAGNDNRSSFTGAGAKMSDDRVFIIERYCILTAELD